MTVPATAISSLRAPAAAGGTHFGWSRLISAISASAQMPMPPKSTKLGVSPFTRRCATDQTTSDGPLASRTVQVQVKDSASATASQNLVIDITPEDEGVQPLFGDTQVNTYEPGDQWYPRVVGLEGANAGSYVVVWRSPSEDGSGNGVYQQLFGDPADFTRQANPVLGDFAGSVTFATAAWRTTGVGCGLAGKGSLPRTKSITTTTSKANNARMGLSKRGVRLNQDSDRSRPAALKKSSSNSGFGVAG